MTNRKNILVINGSASVHSSNERLIERFRRAMEEENEVSVWPDLKSIPHFDPELSVGEVPAQVGALREAIDGADGVVICTPEYIFSIPSGLKNVLEWCVATTIFTDKPVGIITASANGGKGHEELQMIMRTVMAKLSEDTTLLIPGIKGKIDSRGEFTDEKTQKVFERFVDSFKKFLGG
jgi:chromate reductase, NAD(P)H dehydrogenase (quinone)